MIKIDIYSFLTPTLIFLTLFIVQVFIWRIFKPKKQILLLFGMFLIVPVLIFAVSATISDYHQHLPSTVLLLSICVVYIQSFPGFQAVSPSLEMITAIKNKMPKGATHDELVSSIYTEKLLTDRVDDLIKDGFANQDQYGQLKLKGLGLRLAQVFYFYRKFLGLKRGDG